MYSHESGHHTIYGEVVGGLHGPLRPSSHIIVSQLDLIASQKFVRITKKKESMNMEMDVSLASQCRLQIGVKIEKEWEEAEKVMKKNKAMRIEDEDNDDTNDNSNKNKDTLPFACFICKEPFICKYNLEKMHCLFLLHFFNNIKVK